MRQLDVTHDPEKWVTGCLSDKMHAQNQYRNRSQEPGLRIDRIKSWRLNIQSVGVIGAGQMGNGIAHVCALAGFSVMLNDVSPDRIKASLATINGNMARQVAKKTISEDDAQERACADQAGGKIRRIVGLRPGDRDRDREGRRQAQDLRGSVRLAQAGSHHRHQHLVDLDHAAGLVHRPAGAFHRHSFHESGAADGAGRGDPRHRHRRRRPSRPARPSSASSARPSRCRRIFRPSSSTASCCR